ncbi:MAG: THUMP domain-containing protein [Thermoplasmata archaeon]|nr:THUMP domain-containing protein [Thermoplasmata archaeon]
MAIILIRYGETGLKSRPVRARFESLLVENILAAHRNFGISCIIEKQRGRIFVASENPEKSSEIISRTFGVVSLSIAEERTSDIEDISECAVQTIAKEMPRGDSFAIRARRTGTHPYTSMELAAQVGKRVLESAAGFDLSVDLTNPDFELFIEVRNNRSFIFSNVLPGPGGLPMRSQGRVLAMIEDRKSLLAAWLMMRRGCSTILLNQSGLHASDIELLKPWNPWWNGFIESTDPYEIIRLKRCSGLVLGWTLEEFQTKQKPKTEVPLFYPLIGMDEKEIEERMGKITV